MITHEDLIKQYEENCKCKCLLSKPVRMFDENGKFNTDNWNGGDSNIIRNYLYEINNKEHFSIDNGYVDIDYIWRDDETYAVINLTYISYDGNEDITIENDMYIISWYKSRGRIDSFTVNGQLGTEEDYLELLNTLDIEI